MRYRIGRVLEETGESPLARISTGGSGMKEQSRALRRHHRARIIAKRLGIRRHIWFIETEIDKCVPGELAKYNMVCSCWLCAGDKPRRASDGANNRIRRPSEFFTKSKVEGDRACPTQEEFRLFHGTCGYSVIDTYHR